MKKKIFYIGVQTERDFYFYKSYSSKLSHPNDSLVFNTFREAKAWAIGAYQCDLDDIKINIADLRRTKKDNVLWEDEIWDLEES